MPRSVATPLLPHQLAPIERSVSHRGTPRGAFGSALLRSGIGSQRLILASYRGVGDA